MDESGIDYLDDSDSRRESMTARSDLSRPASSVRHPEKGMLDSKSDDHSRISNTKNNVSVPALHFDTTFNTINETKNDWEDSSARSRSTYSGPATDREINNEGVMELPDDFRTLLDTIANKAKTNNKNDFRTKASGKVMEQAYQRCLESVEEQAQLDDMLTQHNRQKQDEWKETLNQKKVNAYKQVEEIRKALDEQMQETHERLRQERLQKTTSPVKFILPDTAGVPDINPKNNRVVVAKALTQQIKANEERKKKIAEESRDRERNYLNQLALEIELNKIKERAQHLEKQKSLLEAWERDGHVRNIKKLQTMGPGAVRNYIQRNLADPMDGTYGSTGQQSLGKSLSMSIGYDPRKSKN